MNPELQKILETAYNCFQKLTDKERNKSAIRIQKVNRKLDGSRSTVQYTVDFRSITK